MSLSLWHGGDIVRHDGADVILAEAVRHERNDVVDNHGRLGDGASLVDTECIYAGERLNAVHIVDKRAAAGEADDAGDEGKAGQKVQSFWDHADDGADGRDHGGDDVAVQPAVFLDEHQHAERNDEEADPFDEARQRAHHLGLWLLAAFLASMVSLETNESAPTAVRRARQPPLTTKLPERRLSPGFLTISSIRR